MNAQARIRGWITRDPIAAALVILTVPIYAAAMLVTPLRPWGGYIATILLGGWVILALITGLKEQRRRFQAETPDRQRSRLEWGLRIVSFTAPLGLWVYSRILDQDGATETQVRNMQDGALLALVVVYVIWTFADWILQQRLNRSADS